MQYVSGASRGAGLAEDLGDFLGVFAAALARGRVVALKARHNGRVRITTEYPDEVSAMSAAAQLLAFVALMDHHRRAMLDRDRRLSRGGQR